MPTELQERLKRRINDAPFRNRYRNLEILSPQDWTELERAVGESNDPFAALEPFRDAFADWWLRYFAVLDVIELQGFRVQPVENYADRGLESRSVYLYHDVHAWDILPAIGIALANRERGICSTFYLSVGHSPVDETNLAGYRILARLAGDNVRIGLHCAPFSSWLRFDAFKGDDRAFNEWIQSDLAGEDLRQLLIEGGKPSFGRYSKDDARQGTFNRLEQNFARLKALAPTARSANHHGDEVVRVYKSIASGRQEDFVAAPRILRHSMVREMGIEVSPSTVARRHRDVTEIYGEGANRTAYLENLYERLERDDPLLLINHPATISNSRVMIRIEFLDKFRRRNGNGGPATARRNGAGGRNGAPIGATAPAKGKWRNVATGRKPDTAPAPVSVTPRNIDLTRGAYLCGLARGGTTWARSVIGQHPQVFEVLGQVQFDKPDEPVSAGLMQRRIAAQLREHGSSDEQIRRAPRFITKAPPNSIILADMIAVVPEAHFLFIMRDPRDVLVSHQRTGAEWTNAHRHFDMAMPRTARFYDGYERAAAAGRVHLFRYEDLHQRFPSTYRDICAYLGVETEAAVIESVLKSASFSSRTGRAHEEKRGMNRRGVVGDWVHNLSHTDALAFQQSLYWTDVFQTHGYGWRTLSMESLLGSAREDGLPAGSWDEPTSGLRIFWSLHGGEWRYAAALAERLRRACDAADAAGFPVALGLTTGIPAGAVRELEPLLQGRRVVVDLDLDRLAKDDEAAVEEAVKTAPLLRQLRPGDAVEVVVRGSNLARVAEVARTISGQEGFRATPLTGPAAPAAAPLAVLTERNGTLFVDGPPEAFDPARRGCWRDVADWSVTLCGHPVDYGVGLPLSLAFRTEFSEMRLSAA